MFDVDLENVEHTQEMRGSFVYVRKETRASILDTSLRLVADTEHLCVLIPASLIYLATVR